MNIDRFIEARKRMGFSQSELAENICTQATLSRFENQGQIPTLKILMKLCTRLNISLGELFPKVEVENSEITKKMNQAEFLLITSEYEQAEQLMTAINLSDIEEANTWLRYHYLNGFIMFFRQRPLIDVMFVFDQILLEKEAANTEIFRLLAYTGIGMIYSRENEDEKAEFYFNKVIEQIYHYPTKNTEDTWRVLHIVFQCGVFYAHIKELAISNALLTYAVTICSDNHVTYYLARAALQLAKNAITTNESEETILELIYDARAYSKINRNQIALKELAQMEEEVKCTRE
ncbi:helix-turn-helix transcriptional regulator [Enterococcus saccharolyticus]|uniref:helix-turn-helix domain-containing protein n=1 Tax=Enterococcus saccharolyticus TaxID=41997 RepID=UPI001E3EC2C5|nr:helix-turn-helix transcriptional regulator [Enterococcus saccharolyticus]MCD5001148.1 helix-turn-helix transcriptional regulator [Enterococcus saccharolyticus]